MLRQMDTNNIKTLTITGGAAVANEGVKKPPRRSVSRRKQIEEFTEESDSSMASPKPMPKPIPSAIPSAIPLVIPETPVIKYNITKSSTSLPLPIPITIKKPIETPQAIPVLNQKVILKPPSPRVKLLNTASQHNGGHRAKIATRKIRRVNIPNLNRKFTRAHKTSLETKETPLDSIRTFLVGKGVIQEKSKAPEKMLRSMYNDFALLKTNAL
jgi:hypothetical protein